MNEEVKDNQCLLHKSPVQGYRQDWNRMQVKEICFPATIVIIAVLRNFAELRNVDSKENIKMFGT